MTRWLPRTRAPLRDALLCAGIVVALFADVVFDGRSIAAAHSQATVGRPAGTAARAYFSRAEGRPARGLVDPSAGALQHEPMQAWMARTLRAGDSPWWNPFSACGSVGPETLVDGKVSLVTLAVAALGGGTGAFHVVLLLLMAGACWALHAALRAGGAAGLEPPLGVLLFLLNGFAIGHLPNPSFLAYLFAPFVWLALQRAVQSPTPARLGLAAAAHAALLLTMFLPVVVVMLIAVHGLCLVEGRATPRRTAGVLAGTALGGLVLGAWVWLPVFESWWTVDLLQRYTSRRTLFAVSELQLLSLVTPQHFFESYAFGIVPPELERAVGPRDAVPHVGVVPLLLAAHGLGQGGRAAARVGLVVAALCAARIFGAPVLGDLLFQTPGLSIIRGPYWASGIGFGFAVAGAHGLARVLPGQAASRPALGAAGGVLALVAWTAWRLGLPTSAPHREWVERTVGLVLLTAILLFVARRARSATPYRVGLVALALLELLTYRNPVRPPRYDLLADPPRYVQVAREAAGEGRVVSIGAFRTLTAEWGSAYGIRQADTLLPSTLPWYRRQFVRAVGDPGRDIVWLAHMRASTLAPIDRAMLDRLAVRCLVVDSTEVPATTALAAQGFPVLYADAERVVFGNPTALPRLHVAPAIVRGEEVGDARGEEALRTVITDDEELLRAAAALRIPATTTARPGDASARIVDEGNAHLTIDVELPWPGVLVLTDTWHPRWRAEVDGAPRAVARVDGSARGLALPAGRHRVALSYRPASLWVGVAVTLLTALGLVAWAVVAWARPAEPGAPLSPPTPLPAPSTPSPATPPAPDGAPLRGPPLDRYSA